MSKQKEIPMSEIRENPVALRTVDKQSEKFQSMKDSVGKYGILNPFSVRERKTEDGVKYYELVDGLHRYSSAKEVGLTTVPVLVVDLNDDEVLVAQMIGNMQRIETAPREYAEQIKRVMLRSPLMTIGDMAGLCCRSAKWVEDRLSLTKINDENIKNLVNTGTINLSNAYALAKLPEDEQKSYLEWATTEAPEVFVPRVTNRVKELRDAKSKGQATAPVVFEPVMHCRKMVELKDAVTDSAIAAAVTAGLSTPAEGFAMALKWVLNVDPASVTEQKAKFDAQQAESAEKAKKRNLELAQKKQAKLIRLTQEAENTQAELEGKPIPHPDLGKKPAVEETAVPA